MIKKYLTGSNIIFVIVLIVLIIPSSRYKVQGYILKLLGSPDPIEDGRQLSPSEMNYELYGLNGDTVNLLDLRGTPMFLNFWATWCGPCMAEMPSIQKMVENHDGKGKVFLISSESPEVLRQFAGRDSMDLPIYYSPYSPAFVTGNSIPLTYVIDSESKIVIERTGASDWNDESILELLQ